MMQKIGMFISALIAVWLWGTGCNGVIPSRESVTQGLLQATATSEPTFTTTAVSSTSAPLPQDNWELTIHSVQEVTELAVAVLDLPSAGLRPDVAKLRAGVLAECALPVREVFQLWTVTVKNGANTTQPLPINFSYRANAIRLLEATGAPLPARLVGVFIKDQNATLHLIMDGQATYKLKAQQAVDFAFVFDLPAGTMGRLALLDLPAHAFPVTAPIAATTPVANLVSTEGLRIVQRHSCSTRQMTMPYFDRLTGERSEKTLVATRGRLLTIGLTLSGPQDPIVLEEIGLVDCTGQRYEPVQFRQGYEWYYLRDPDHPRWGRHSMRNSAFISLNLRQTQTSLGGKSAPGGIISPKHPDRKWVCSLCSMCLKRVALCNSTSRGCPLFLCQQFVDCRHL